MARIIFKRPGRACFATLLLASMLGGIASARELYPFACDSDGDYGTQVSWIENISEARREAVVKDKLLMVMQISGDFTKPTFT